MHLLFVYVSMRTATAFCAESLPQNKASAKAGLVGRLHCYRNGAPPYILMGACNRWITVNLNLFLVNLEV